MKVSRKGEMNMLSQKEIESLQSGVNMLAELQQSFIPQDVNPESGWTEHDGYQTRTIELRSPDGNEWKQIFVSRDKDKMPTQASVYYNDPQSDTGIGSLRLKNDELTMTHGEFAFMAGTGYPTTVELSKQAPISDENPDGNLTFGEIFMNRIKAEFDKENLSNWEVQTNPVAMEETVETA